MGFSGGCIPVFAWHPSSLVLINPPGRCLLLLLLREMYLWGMLRCREGGEGQAAQGRAEVGRVWHRGLNVRSPYMQ